MPPKKPAPAVAPKKATTSKVASKPAAAKAVPAKGKTTTPTKAPAAKKGDSKTVASKPPAPPAKKWTEQDDMARKIQTIIRGFLARRKLKKLKKGKQDYEDLMDKLERDACIAIAQQRQKEAEEEARKEAEERKRKAEEKKRIKRMLEAAFDGEMDEVNIILKEVKELDDKMGIGTDMIGEALRQRHMMNMVDCEDAHGHTPLSEAASGGSAEMCRFLIDRGADPNSRGQFDRTPLYRAAFAGHLDCVETLLQYGGDPRLYASDGQTAANVTSIEAIKDVLESWDNEHTDQLLTKIEAEKERRKEKERQRREAEKNELDREMDLLQKEFDANQKTLNKLYCELNKRIDEHDHAPALGFEKPEITIQAIKDCEDQVEIAKLDFEKTKEKIRGLKMLQREKIKEAAEAEGEELPGLHITIQELPDLLLRDVGNRIRDSGRWPLIIDTSNRTPTFLRYQDTNYVNALMPRDVETNSLRMSLLGAIRYGKPFVLDMLEVDMFQTVADRMEEITAGLMASIMDKSILNEDKYLKLVRPEDGDDYDHRKFNSMRLERFKFVIITKNIFPSESLMDQSYVVRIHIPE